MSLKLVLSSPAVARLLMVAFGLFMGLIFPFYSRMFFGEAAFSPLYVLGCLFAGLAVSSVCFHVARRLYSALVKQEQQARELLGEREGELEWLAFYDSLTHLPNRRLFLDRVQHAIEVARAGNKKFVVYFIDLDRFKKINDTLGHEGGDLLLREVAGRIKACLGDGDTVARFNGDEFVVFTESVEPLDPAIRLAQRLIEVVGAPLTIAGQEVFPTASLGASVYPNDGQQAEPLIRQADLAMCRAKAAGGGQWQFYTEDTDRRAHKRLSLESDLYRALDGGQFEVYYQPQYDLATGHICGVEALLRWNHPARKRVAPVEFIPLAEETGLILPIGRWVLQEACAEAAQWPSRVTVSVNVSARQFQDPNFIDCVKEVLQCSTLPPGRLMLELTESMILSDVSSVTHRMRALSDLGVRCSLDDFGVGYTSLSHLRTLPLAEVKIDRSYICRAPHDKSSAAVVSAIMLIAKDLGFNAVAEGIETEEQRRFVAAKGCPCVQGFLLARPLPAKELKPLLENRRAPLG